MQDGCILHADPGQSGILGARVSLGHGAIVHGARVDDDVLGRMRATVLNGTQIGCGSVIAAGAVVTPGTLVPPRSLVTGSPAKAVSQTTDEDVDLVPATAENYLACGRHYRQPHTTTDGAHSAIGPSGNGAGGPEASRLLRGLAVFAGLNEPELLRMAGICRIQTYSRGQVIANQDAEVSDVYVVRAGLLEISVGEAGQGVLPPHTVVNPGEGQVVRKMALIEHGPRSATVRGVSTACSLIVTKRDAFEQLCSAERHIGLSENRNLAAALSIRLWHRHLARRQRPTWFSS